jgi:hypothetical protein
MFPNNSRDIRLFLKNVWAKTQKGETLDGVELQLSGIMQIHPEYHALLNSDDFIDKVFEKENPIMHLFSHQALLEQLSINRPEGIVDLYAAFVKKIGDAHEAEHQMIEVLAAELYGTLHQKREFDEKKYLEDLRKKLESAG